MKKSLFYTLILTALFLFNLGNIQAAVNAPLKSAVKPAIKQQSVAYLTVNPVDVVNYPTRYLNKNISFTAELVAFTSLGLDYKPAYRDPAKYIGVLIKRPDVVGHTIPLSEMKIFITRELAEKNMDADVGDQIKVSGKVFSTALGDPWVDATSFTIIEKKEKSEK